MRLAGDAECKQGTATISNGNLMEFNLTSGFLINSSVGKI